MPRSPSVPWTREHLLVALNLYRKLPFGKLDKGNPLVREVAAKMGRTPSSLAMKLTNLASFDPVQKARKVSGLKRASKQDEEMWNEFNSNLAELAPQSEQLLHDLFTRDEGVEVDFLDGKNVRLVRSSAHDGATEAIALVKVRRGQQFFRQSILSAYGVRCCISGIGIPRLLVASHIRPWRDFPGELLDPRNGLCLSSLHDAAFDGGLITLDESLRVVLGKSLRGHFPNEILEKSFSVFEGKPIRFPEKLAQPSTEFLAHHREKIFQG